MEEKQNKNSEKILKCKKCHEFGHFNCHFDQMNKISEDEIYERSEEESGIQILKNFRLKKNDIR